MYAIRSYYDQRPLHGARVTEATVGLDGEGRPNELGESVGHVGALDAYVGRLGHEDLA